MSISKDIDTRRESLRRLQTVHNSILDHNTAQYYMNDNLQTEKILDPILPEKNIVSQDNIHDPQNILLPMRDVTHDTLLQIPEQKLPTRKEGRNPMHKNIVSRTEDRDLWTKTLLHELKDIAEDEQLIHQLLVDEDIDSFDNSLDYDPFYDNESIRQNESNYEYKQNNESIPMAMDNDSIRSMSSETFSKQPSNYVQKEMVPSNNPQRLPFNNEHHHHTGLPEMNVHTNTVDSQQNLNIPRHPPSHLNDDDNNLLPLVEDKLSSGYPIDLPSSNQYTLQQDKENNQMVPNHEIIPSSHQKDTIKNDDDINNSNNNSFNRFPVQLDDTLNKKTHTQMNSLENNKILQKDNMLPSNFKNEKQQYDNFILEYQKQNIDLLEQNDKNNSILHSNVEEDDLKGNEDIFIKGKNDIIENDIQDSEPISQTSEHYEIIHKHRSVQNDISEKDTLHNITKEEISQTDPNIQKKESLQVDILENDTINNFAQEQNNNQDTKSSDENDSKHQEDSKSIQQGDSEGNADTDTMDVNSKDQNLSSNSVQEDNVPNTIAVNTTDAFNQEFSFDDQPYMDENNYFDPSLFGDGDEQYNSGYPQYFPNDDESNQYLNGDNIDYPYPQNNYMEGQGDPSKNDNSEYYFQDPAPAPVATLQQDRNTVPPYSQNIAVVETTSQEIIDPMNQTEPGSMKTKGSSAASTNHVNQVPMRVSSTASSTASTNHVEQESNRISTMGSSITSITENHSSLEINDGQNHHNHYPSMELLSQQSSHLHHDNSETVMKHDHNNDRVLSMLPPDQLNTQKHSGTPTMKNNSMNTPVDAVLSMNGDHRVPINNYKENNHISDDSILAMIPSKDTQPSTQRNTVPQKLQMNDDRILPMVSHSSNKVIDPILPHSRDHNIVLPMLPRKTGNLHLHQVDDQINYKPHNNSKNENSIEFKDPKSEKNNNDDIDNFDILDLDDHTPRELSHVENTTTNKNKVSKNIRDRHSRLNALQVNNKKIILNDHESHDLFDNNDHRSHESVNNSDYGSQKLLQNNNQQLINDPSNIMDNTSSNDPSNNSSTNDPSDNSSINDPSNNQQSTITNNQLENNSVPFSQESTIINNQFENDPVPFNQEESLQNPSYTHTLQEFDNLSNNSIPLDPSQLYQDQSLQESEDTPIINGSLQIDPSQNIPSNDYHIQTPTNESFQDQPSEIQPDNNNERMMLENIYNNANYDATEPNNFVSMENFVHNGFNNPASFSENDDYYSKIIDDDTQFGILPLDDGF